MPKGPLEGIRVVDCSTGMAGTRMTGLFADYGANVVWVEPPGGDPLRRTLPSAAAVFNRGKRSVVLDMDVDAERRRVVELTRGADVFVESWSPGRADALGLGFTDLRRGNPGLVYCSISGFGVDGPYRDIPAHDALVHAVVGTMAEQAGLRDAPIFEALPMASMGAAYLGAIGVLASVYRRGHDGVGRHVETSLLDGALAYHAMFWGESDESVAAMQGAPPRAGAFFGKTTMRLITRSFECADGEYIGVHTGAVGAFGRLMKVLGLDDRIPPSPNGMDMGLPLTPEQADLLDGEIYDIFRSQPRDHWARVLIDADVCAIEHLRPGQVFDEPQARHNDMLVAIDDPVLGRIEQVAPAAKFPANSPLVGIPAPLPGADTDGVLAELAADPAADVRRQPAAPNEEPLLAGVRILDLGAYYAGPFSSRLLADLGADVIKLEPVTGDQLRGLERAFFSAQSGKRAIAANVKDPDLRPAVEELVRRCDVIHHNLRPGAAERLSLDWESAHAINPAVVYLYAPGWGSSGPHALRQSFAPMLSGYVGVTYDIAGELNPPMPPVGNEDTGNGLLGAVAILMALLERQRTGRGQYVENPQLNASIAHMTHVVRNPDGTAVGANRLDVLQFGFGPFERLYETADGWVCLVADQLDAAARVEEVIGLELPDHQDAASDLIAASLATRPTADVIKALAAVGIGAVEPVTEHNSHAYMNDPENRRTRRVAEVAHPVKGNVRELDVLLRVSDTVIPPHRLPPELGEHTDEILTWVGYDRETIDALRARGAIA